MSLKLMYITQQPEIAQIVEKAGVNRIFVDMEYIGKSERQGGMDTVQSNHTVEDVRTVRKTVSQAEVLVRINPIHEKTDAYSSSKEEIDAVIEAGADILMLPYFKTVCEVQKFIDEVNGRVRTMLLIETPEAVSVIDEILNIEGIDEVYIGLNDLSLGYGKKFMFELLADGTVESLCFKFKEKGIPYGFGGIASLGKGMLPAEYIIPEHYRMGSSCVILSRSFCNMSETNSLNDVELIFKNEIEKVRKLEMECETFSSKYFSENKKLVMGKVEMIVTGMEKNI